MSIEILSSTLANQIAAGEVIERPASVVKELVENAIDAGSTQIDIMVEEAGLNKIQVMDNGAGIPAEEAVKAFERHATSKIMNNEDLFRIRSLGFRGEALPSIASVSECLIETSTGDLPGTKVFLKGGEVVEQTAGPSRKGTTVTVTQLFYNTPARLKYIKSIKTEFVYPNTLNTLSELGTKLGAYIWWFNNKRLHSTLGYLPPVEFREKHSL